MGQTDVGREQGLRCDRVHSQEKLWVTPFCVPLIWDRLVWYPIFICLICTEMKYYKWNEKFSHLLKGHDPLIWKAVLNDITARPTRASQTASEAIKYIPTLCNFLLLQIIITTIQLPTMVTNIITSITTNWPATISNESLKKLVLVESELSLTKDDISVVGKMVKSNGT